jgi:hypothetical protein
MVSRSIEVQVFTISCSLFFLSQFYRVSNAVIAPQLLSDLSVDTKGLGLISASFFYAFALTQIPISLFLDNLVCHLCPLRCFRRLSGPLGRSLPDGSHGVFRPDGRQSHFTANCRHDSGGPLLGCCLRQVV